MSYHVSAAAQNAILDGGLPALITLGGGSLRVALFLDGVECSGNGYARQIVSTASAAASGQKDLTNVTFTASGGSIVYNQAKVYAADGVTLFLTSGISADNTIGAEAHVMTLSLRTLDNAPIYCANPAEIQAALNAQQTSRQKVAAAGIDHAFTSTLVADGGVGGWLEGLAAHEPSNDYYDRLSTVFRWAGARGGGASDPLFRYELGRMILRHILFAGANHSEIIAASVAKAYCAILMRRALAPYAGTGTGKILGSDLYFSWFEKAIILAENLADNNCDECSWYDLGFDRNDIAVELRGRQTLGHHFWHPRFGDNTICFNIIAGGDVSITNGLMAGRGNTLLNFPASGSGTDNFGGNNNSYAINKLKVDAQATGCKIVNQALETSAGYYSNFDLNGIHFPPPQAANGSPQELWGGPAFVGAANSTFNITNAIGLGRSMIQHQTGVHGVTRFRIINADINRGSVDPIDDVRDIVDQSGKVGVAHYTFEACHYNGQQGYFADWAGTI